MITDRPELVIFIAANQNPVIMKYFFALMLLVAIGCRQPSLNQEKINYEGEKILVGEINWEGLTQEPYKVWFSGGYLNYQPDTATLQSLQPGALDGVEAVMYMGTWCTDSQEQVPQIYKILDYLHFDLDKLRVYALERTAEQPLVLSAEQQEKYKITLVPTLIFYRHGKELGRITERPVTTLEQDMVNILNKSVSE